jgi:hypothetical protein
LAYRLVSSELSLSLLMDVEGDTDLDLIVSLL